MKNLHYRVATLGLVVLTLAAASILAGPPQPKAPAQGQPPAPAPPAAQPRHPSGQLVLWGDVALFDRPDAPDNCILTNRYKKGQRVGFRMTAIDGGTGEIENTAILVVHVRYAGK